MPRTNGRRLFVRNSFRKSRYTESSPSAPAAVISNSSFLAGDMKGLATVESRAGLAAKLCVRFVISAYIRLSAPFPTANFSSALAYRLGINPSFIASKLLPEPWPHPAMRLTGFSCSSPFRQEANQPASAVLSHLSSAHGSPGLQ